MFYNDISLPGLQVAWKYVVSVFLLQWAYLQELAPNQKWQVLSLLFFSLPYVDPVVILSKETA